MKKIPMFKPGVKSHHASMLHVYDTDIAPTKPDQFHGIWFAEACQRYLGIEFDPAYKSVIEAMDSCQYIPHRVVLAHADGCRPHTFGAAYAVYKFLFIRNGRSFIFSPDSAPFMDARRLIERLIKTYPTLIDQLGFNAFSIWVKSNPDRRLEWVHPDSLTHEKVQYAARELSFVYVEKAHQCSNELLEALSAELWPHQASLIAGVPLSAQGAFKTLWEAESFSRFKLTAHDMTDYFMPEVEQLRLQVGEDSDHYRSMILAEFPPA